MRPLSLVLFVVFHWFVSNEALGNKGYEAQLYEDLLYDYNKIPRPVKNSSDILLVDVGASLIRIIDVDEKNQVLTTNVWLEMRWTDIKLQWKPEKYGGIKALHIPIVYIWSPDIVLYNNAAGDPDITIFTDAHVSYDGRVYWQPPAIYKSFCSIDVTWFPYDIQNCNMKFGTWSYTGFYVDLRQLPHEKVITQKDADGSDIEFMKDGMDLSFFYKSAEWDLLSLTSARHSVLYASCCGPEKYVDITYYFVLRRKTLFFTSNLMVPCFLISFLTTFVFWLSDHKITFSISILVTLTVFFLVLIDIMPPTSLVIPMFGRYLTTTLILVSLSTLISVISVNFRYRSGAAYQMSPWIRQIFINCLPRLLNMKRPERQPRPVLKKDPNFSTSKLFTQSCASLSSLAPAIIKPYAYSTPLCANLSANHHFANVKQRLRSELDQQQQQIPPRPTPLPKEPHNYYASLSRAYLSTAKKNGSVRRERLREISISFVDESQRKNSAGNKPDKRKKNRVSNGFARENSEPNDSTPVGIGIFEHAGRFSRRNCGASQQQQQPSTSSTEAEPCDYNRTNTESTPSKRDDLKSQSSIEAVKMIKQKVNDVIFANLLRQVRFIAEHFRRNEEESEISDDWTFVAMVLDRLFLYIFGILNIATFSILLEAPSLYDSSEPLNITYSHTTASRPLGVINLSFCAKMQNTCAAVLHK